MADNDQPSRLEAATVKAEAGSQIVSDFANLPADQTVATASGNIPTLAGVIGTIQEEGDQAAADVRAKADAQVQAAIGTLVKRAGDSMSGLLILSGDPTSSLGAAPKRYVDTGDTNTLAASKTYTDQKVASVPAQTISKYYESAQLDISANGVLPLTHGLGGVPRILAAQIVNVVAFGGYQPGDIIEFPTIVTVSGSAIGGMTVEKNSTQLIIRYSSNPASTAIVSKQTPGGSQNLGAVGNWKLVVRAYL